MQTAYRKRMMQAKYNETGKIDTLTVDWLNIWQHPKKQPRMSHKNVTVSLRFYYSRCYFIFFQTCVIAQLHVFHNSKKKYSGYLICLTSYASLQITCDNLVT